MARLFSSELVRSLTDFAFDGFGELNVTGKHFEFVLNFLPILA